MQMTMMATPNINKELHYLNKEDQLLRWLLVKHRDTKYGLEFLSEEDNINDFNKFPRSSIYDDEDIDKDDEDDEYNVDKEGKQTSSYLCPRSYLCFHPLAYCWKPRCKFCHNFD